MRDLAADIWIIESQRRVAQEQRQARYGEPPVVAAKAAVAIAQAALVGRQREERAAAAVENGYALQHLAQFAPVRADVLHRCRPHRAGNQRQIFQAADAASQRGAHEIVPRLAGARGDAPRSSRKPLEGHPAQAQQQRQARQPRAQNEVGTAADQSDRKTAPVGVDQMFGKLFLALRDA